MKRIAVYGGRDFAERAVVRHAMWRLHHKHGLVTIVHGACNYRPEEQCYRPKLGADYFAHELCEQHPEAFIEAPFPADWSLGLRAGPLRNQTMVDTGLDGAVEFPGGRGTLDMRLRLQRAGVPIWRPLSSAA